MAQPTLQITLTLTIIYCTFSVAQNINSECIGNIECLETQVCQDGECVDPCLTACGRNADCKVKNQAAICSCPAGTTGDPYAYCLPSSCENSKDCDFANRTCIDGVCELLSQFKVTYIGPYVSPSLTYFGVEATCASATTCGDYGRCRKTDYIGQVICRCPNGHVKVNGTQTCSPPPIGQDNAEDPCLKLKCGINAVCKKRDGRGICTCPRGFFGNPLKSCNQEEINCIADVECPETHACVNRGCVDACAGLCGKNGDCTVKNHSPRCSCPPSSTGDAYTHCYENSCDNHTECEYQSNRTCINGLCQLSSQYSFEYIGPEVPKDLTTFARQTTCSMNPCGPGGRCRDDTYQGWIVCRCPYGHASGPDGNLRCNDKRKKITQDSSGCKDSVTKLNSQRKVCANEVIFEENFNDFDTSKWTQVIRFADKPDYEFVAYIKDKEILETKDGMLVIKPKLSTLKFNDENFVNSQYDFQTSCTGVKNSPDCFRKAFRYNILPPVVSGRINTKGKFSFQYGKVEVRAKLPAGNWIYPELFINPEANTYGADYDSGQMRVAFLPGNADTNKQLSGGLILGSSSIARTTFLRSAISPISWSDTFHNFTLVWTPSFISFRVDDDEYSRIQPPETGFGSLSDTLKLSNAAQLWQTSGKMAPFDQEYYLDIGVGVGGVQFPDGPEKPWKHTDPKAMLEFWRNRETWYSTWGENSKLEVDYIKVYAI